MKKYNFSIYKYLVTVCFLVPVTLIFCGGMNNAYSLLANNEVVLTLKLKQKPLQEVLDLVAEQTGYTVKIEEKFANRLVSGNFVSINVETLFQRILKGENKIIVISPQQKTIIVKTAGQKNNVSFISSRVSHSTSKVVDLGLLELDNDQPISKVVNNMHLVDRLTGRTWAEEDKIMEEFSQRIIKQPWSTSVESGLHGLHEMNNDFPVKETDNDRHVVDHLTGKNWDEEEAVLKKIEQQILQQKWTTSIESGKLGIYELIPNPQKKSSTEL